MNKVEYFKPDDPITEAEFTFIPIKKKSYIISDMDLRYYKYMVGKIYRKFNIKKDKFPRR